MYLAGEVKEEVVAAANQAEEKTNEVVADVQAAAQGTHFHFLKNKMFLFLSFFLSLSEVKSEAEQKGRLALVFLSLFLMTNIFLSFSWRSSKSNSRRC